MRHLIALTLGALFIMTSASANAQEVTATSRSAGMGEALTAGSAGTSAIWHNPAGVASAVMYSAEANYAYEASTGASGVTASLLDTKSNPNLGLGLAFTYETSSRQDTQALEGYHFRGAFGVPLAGGFLKLGSTLRYSSITLDEELAMEALLLDAGLVAQFTDSFSIGVTGHNLVNGGNDELAPPGLAIGAAFSSVDLGVHVSGDVLMDLTQEGARTWRAGAEYLLMQVAPIRAGYSYGELDGASRVSAGIGYRHRTSAVGLDAAFQQNLQLKSDRSILAALSIYL